MYKICYNINEILLKISKQRCKIQQKNSEATKVSIQLLEKPTKYLKPISKS